MIRASGRAPFAETTLNPAVGPSRGKLPLASVAVFVSLAGVAAGMTLLFLGMRSVMEVGGACADGGPYVPAQPCPDGTPLAILGGLFGGVIAFGVYLVQVLAHRIRNFIVFAWPALFLSLGWNFLEYGLDAPGEQRFAWGWLVCAVLFAIMGAAPLVLARDAVAGVLPFGGGSPSSTVLWPAARTRSGSPPPPPVLVVHPGRDGSAGAASRIVDALERLSALRAAGALSEDEFMAAKRQLLEDDR